MTQAQITNILIYVAYAFAGAAVATGLQLAVVLAGTDPIVIRPLLATFVSSFFGALSTAFASSFRPRIGSENLSSQVNDFRAMGFSRQDMRVTLKRDHTNA